MLRKRIAELSVRDGRYFFEAEPYSGVGFEAGEGRSVSAILIEKGEIVSAYQSPYFPRAEHSRQIDISGFTVDDVAGEDAKLSNGNDLEYDLAGGYYDLFVGAKAYSGLAYGFRRGSCINEFFYTNGRLVGSAYWDLAGNLRTLYLSDDMEQHYGWHASGKLRVASIQVIGRTSDGVATSLLSGSFAFSEDGSIAVLSMDKPFVSFLQTDAAKMIYRPIDTIRDIGSFRGAERLWLSGDGVDDEVLSTLFHGGVLDTTYELAMSATLISDSNANLEVLANNRLKKLRFNSNRNLGTEFLDKVRQRRPDIKIECLAH